MKNKIIIGAILFLGLILRLLFVTKLPLYGDELTMVYDTFSVLKTGHDQLGNFLPITFHMGAGRPGGYIYFSIPFVAFFGPTALGVRSLSILSGLGLIVIMYFLGRKLLDEKVGLMAAFITAISPWDLSLSRGGFEAHFALMLSALGFLFFLKAKDNPKYYLGIAASWGLAIHTYPTYKLTLFLFIPLLIWYEREVVKDFFSKEKRWIKLVALVIGAVAVVVSAQQTLFGNSEQRFTNINIFADPGVKQQSIQKVNFERTIDSIGKSLSPVFHNQPVEYFVSLKNAYLNNLSFDFLFISGDGNPLHNMTGIGELYLVESVLIFIGLITLWGKDDRKLFVFLISWLLIAPVATALLITPHALRDSFMLPPLILLSALGLSKIVEIEKKNVRYVYLGLVGIFWLVQFIFLLDKFYFLAPVKYNEFWSYPAKAAVTLADNNKNQYDYVFLSDKIDNVQYAYPVYNKIDPNIVIAVNKIPFNFGAYKFRKYGNVYITDIPDTEVGDFVDSINGTALYIGDPTEKINSSKLEMVDGPTGSKMLYVIKKRI
ncbi:MAG TPA: glycosyltransferase family 39 protein [Candidatus Saccharimonadales bacterium]|jgi:4-amino-4-deoxy-L-arabinose transferase-like glycosyltransferase|nr:glycosyltransferase family 39 protein [Candidatus Saccharimonadales bacterium]